MKPFITLLCLLLVSAFSNAQYQYVPMPTANAAWNAINQPAVMRASTCYKYQYKLTGNFKVSGADTFYIVEKRARYMGYAAIAPGRPEPVEAIEFVNSCNAERPFEAPVTANQLTDTIWAIEKNKKIYVLDSTHLDTTIHKTFVDFSLTYVGEVIDRYPFDDTVLAIDTISINGTLRRRIVTTFYEYPQRNKQDTLIEGIGSLRFGLGFKDLMVEGQDMAIRGKVYCVSVNNMQEYNYKNSACAPMWPLEINSVFSEELLQVFPNPFSNAITVNSREIATVKVYNMTGNCIYSGNISPDKTLSIQTQNWSTGLYIVGLQSEKGSRSFKVTKY